MTFRVLIVDDSDVMRSILRRVLSLSGIGIGEVLEAPDGDAALKIMAKNRVDIVMTDIIMPVMTGREMIARMKASKELADIPVIVVSTEGRNEMIEGIMEAGAAGYITKPFRPEDVAKTVYRALGVTPDERHIEEPEDSDF
ncbi:MAG: response regulator [Candidatus Latescibacterota bacterium]